MHHVQCSQRESLTRRIVRICGHRTIGHRLGVPTLQELVVVPSLEQISENTQRPAVTDHENALARPVPEQHAQEEVHALGHFGETLTAGRAREEPAERVQ